MNPRIFLGQIRIGFSVIEPVQGTTEIVRAIECSVEGEHQISGGPRRGRSTGAVSADNTVRFDDFSIVPLEIVEPTLNIEGAQIGRGRAKKMNLDEALAKEIGAKSVVDRNVLEVVEGVVVRGH